MESTSIRDCLKQTRRILVEKRLSAMALHLPVLVACAMQNVEYNSTDERATPDVSARVFFLPSFQEGGVMVSAEQSAMGHTAGTLPAGSLVVPVNWTRPIFPGKTN
jgi:hypothetical protein